MKKRKYTRFGETPQAYECTKRKCKWQGTADKKESSEIKDGVIRHLCPKCGNDEFYGLIEKPVTPTQTIYEGLIN